MKNKATFGLIALIAVIGFSFAACSDGGDPVDGKKGVAPTITTATLQGGTVETAYSQTLVATGDTPITWSLDGGTSLPAGLNLTGAVIAGTPTTTGTSTFTVKATNAAGSDTKQLSIAIAAGGAPAITTANLPNGTVGTAYTHTLVATGDAPITWTIDSGALPDGLGIAGAVISGEPTTAGTSNFTVKAANAKGNVTKSLSITITGDDNGSDDGLSLETAIPLTENVWEDGNLTDTVRAVWYSFPVSSGTTYYVWWNGGYTGFGDGTKTADIDVRAVYEDDITATIFFWKNQGWTSATPVTANRNGTVYLTVRGNMDLSTRKGTFSIVYSRDSTRPSTGGIGGPTITPATLPNGTVGTAYSQTLSATGAATITWNLEIGALPTNLNLSTSGAITGTPTAAGTFSFTVKATNSDGSDTSQFTITIDDGGNPIIRVPIEMVQITGGTFTMGSPTTETDREKDETPHEVTLTGFSMGKYPVTQEQYEAVMESNPSAHQVGGFRASNLGGITDTSHFPVDQVSWYEALVFCNTLSMLEDLSPAYSMPDFNDSTDPADWGNVPTRSGDPNIELWNAVEIVADSTGYRLPTEAQWEYACRAGTETAYHTGNTISDNTGWYSANSNSRTHSVGGKQANAFGLYDMHGNVNEWCWDWFITSYYSSSPAQDPTGPVSVFNTVRVQRGGSFFDTAQYVRSAYRFNGNPRSGGYTVGFRIVRPEQ
jgi:formylglycine-generating enzyme required for sulfatase activity